MKKFFAVFGFLCLALAASGAQAAVTTTGEAYAMPTYEELSQTELMLGGIDINDPRRKWNQLLVTVREAPKLGPVMAAIQTALEANGLDEIARVKRRRLVEPAPPARSP